MATQEATTAACGGGGTGVRQRLAAARRVVVKVGTSSLTSPDGNLDAGKLDSLADELARAQGGGRELILVSSGAVAAGRGRLGLHERPALLPQQQAAAAVGQGLLMHAYEQAFGRRGVVVAQVLLTREDVARRERYLNARNTFLQLLRWGCLPIVNENDTVAVEELRFGDNDTLSALVATLVGADALMILTDVDGLYSADPHHDPEATLLGEVAAITPELLAAAAGPGDPNRGRGGMRTKLEAARIATACGTTVVLAASRPDVLGEVLEGKAIGTVFAPRAFQPAWKRWIVGHDRPHGRIVVDGGAQVALLEEGKSLLAAGVVRVEGSFARGALVQVVNESGRELARGLTNYSAAEIAAIKGVHTADIERVLGRRDFDEVIHRDNLVISF